MFSDLIYYLLLIITAVAYFSFGKSLRSIVLALTGVLFYTFYAGSWVLLPLGIAVMAYPLLFQVRGRALTVGIWTTILVSIIALVSFKYLKFLGGLLGFSANVQWPVPLALSFFTFEFIHAAIETRRGTIQNVRFWDWMAFIFFFPTMIAGPIKRWSHFESSIQGRNADAKDMLEGIYRICLGLFKKLILADNINTVIDQLGSPHSGAKSLNLVLAVFLFGFRIWLDFAGYSDIAIGSARILGIRVPENFLSPYTQSNIAAFWRNWHISLTNWITDYLFIPLGGSQVSQWRVCLNLVIVMFISGLWHGAGMNFIIWGLWHGVLLVVYRLYSVNVTPKLPRKFVESWPTRFASYSITMIGVWIGWLFFMFPSTDLVLLFGYKGVAR